MANVKVVVVGAYKAPSKKKGEKPQEVALNTVLSVDEKLAEKGIAAGVFADPKSMPPVPSSPEDKAALEEAKEVIEDLNAELKSAKGYQKKVEGLLKNEKITIEQLRAALKPAD